MTQVDARGLSCPLPLMMTKKALDARPAELMVLCDSGTAKANVVNLLSDFGFAVDVAEESGEYKISARR